MTIPWISEVIPPHTQAYGPSYGVKRFQTGTGDIVWDQGDVG